MELASSEEENEDDLENDNKTGENNDLEKAYNAEIKDESESSDNYSDSDNNTEEKAEKKLLVIYPY